MTDGKKTTRLYEDDDVTVDFEQPLTPMEALEERVASLEKRLQQHITPRDNTKSAYDLSRRPRGYRGPF